jgi:hypothetical protein
MKILNSLTIVADDLNLSVNPLGLQISSNLSTTLLNDYLISAESYQGYVDTVINNDNIWYNGETFPFILVTLLQKIRLVYMHRVRYVTINTQKISILLMLQI